MTSNITGPDDYPPGSGPGTWVQCACGTWVPCSTNGTPYSHTCEGHR